MKAKLTKDIFGRKKGETVELSEAQMELAIKKDAIKKAVAKKADKPKENKADKPKENK